MAGTMENVILSPVPLDQLKELFTAIVRQEIRAKAQEEFKEKFLSPKETCALFSPKISLVTLNAWAAKGLLNKHYIGSRTYYRQSEVIEAVKSLKRYSHNQKG